ncbi:MAG: gliding motility-associated C-terminal domain-containing protein [Bacteroidia bacterium]|nr:gliding motility-associated C-terminal domain-containing protein [Bacteroidia bacterium]
MNTNKLLTYLLVVLGYTAMNISVNAQTTDNWANKMPKNQLFIENKGQFVLPAYLKQQSLFTLDYGKLKIHVTSKGLVYQVLSEKVKTNEEREKLERAMRKAGKSHLEIEAAEHKVDITQEFIQMNFENASTTTQVEVKDKNTDYFSYSFRNAKGGEEHINNINGYKVITFKNIYPNIDLEYTAHVTDGLKYAFIVNVGGDVSSIKMNYNSTNILLKNNNVIINTLLGKIIDHAPKTFYANETQNTIASKFIKAGNTVSFDVAPYNHSKTMVIDPWTQTPAINNSQAVWEVERDGLGNVYIIGGDSPMKLIKYNNAGLLQWTYVTPYDTAGGWLGTLATDLAGNSYVTNGTDASITKVDNGGSVLWSKSETLKEYWSIAFNCDQTKIIVGGSKLTGLTNVEPAVFDINTSNGNILATKIPTGAGSLSSFPPNIHEVRAICASPSSKYFYLTQDTIGIFSDDFNACGGTSNGSIAKIDHTYNFGYKCENYRSKGNSGICAIKANKKFVYTQNGALVHKRDLNTMAILATATIPGGVSSTSGGKKMVQNSGLDLDTCGNVYVGSSTGISKFDANLNLITSVTTTFKVYDVAVSTGGNVIAVGATGNSTTTTTRNGTVQSFNMGACFPIKLECCNSTVCPVPNKCTTDATFQLNALQTGGTFSGGAYVTATGMFNPATAGVGTHIIVYTLPCGSDTIKIIVKACASLVVCKNSNGSLQVTGGTNPYTWEKIVRTKDCSSGFCVFDCTLPMCTTYVTTYVNISNTNTATPTASTDSIRVKDNAGNELLIYNQSILPACSGCALVANIQSKTDATCGANNGSATVTTTSATYSWNTTPVQTSQTATALSAGTYICTVTQGGCTDTAKVTIAASANIIANITAQSPATCGANNGTAVVTYIAGATYSWNTTPVQTNDTATNLAAGTYICTVAQGSCTDTAKVTIVASATLVASATSVNASCGNANGSATVDITGVTYSWNTSPVQTTQTITGLNAGTYICTVSQGACTDTAQVTITNNANMVITITGDTTICANGTTTLTANAPSATSYSWNTSPMQTTAAITVTPSASTFYTVTASNGTCSGTQTIHVNALSTSSAFILGDTLVCLGEPVALTASTGTSYAWTPSGATAQSIVFVANVPATFTVVVTNATAPAACQTSTATINIKIYPYSSTINAGADQTVSIGQPATLTATGATNGYTWNTNQTTPSINVTPTKTTVYTVKSTDTFGCVTADSVRVTVDLNCGDLFIATAFSPNDDGANDIECVLGSCVTAVSWAVYDRWGEKVFESNAVTDCWNGTYKGKPLNTGVYVYKLSATLRSGETVSKNGNITLTR